MEHTATLPDYKSSVRASTTRAEAALERLATEAQSISRQDSLAQLGLLTSLIAHEINNILTPVRSYAQLALANPNDSGLTLKALNQAVDGTTRATRIAAAILAIGGSRTEPSAPSVCSTWNTPSRTPSRSSLAKIVSTTIAALPHTDSQILVNSSSQLADTFTTMDAVALQHVISNAILNARRAGQSKRVNISIALVDPTSELPDGPSGCSTWNTRTSGPWRENVLQNAASYACIEITDNGRGMTPETLDSLFRATPARTKHSSNLENTNQTTNDSGSGLGLMVCRALVEAARGWVVVSSALGVGTRVRVILPRASEPDSQSPCD